MLTVIIIALAIVISSALGFLFGVGYVKHEAHRAAKTLEKSTEYFNRAADFYKAAESIEEKRHAEFQRLEADLRTLEGTGTERENLN